MEAEGSKRRRASPSDGRNTMTKKPRAGGYVPTERYSRHYFEKQSRDKVASDMFDSNSIDPEDTDGMLSAGIFSRPENKWLQRIRTAANLIRVDTIRKATPRLNFATTGRSPRSFISQILEDLTDPANALPGRNFIAHGAREPKPSRNWLFSVRDANTNEIRKVNCALFRKRDLDSVTAMQVCAELATIMNSIPTTTDELSAPMNSVGGHSPTASWVSLALRQKYVGANPLFKPIIEEMRGGKPALCLRIDQIDPVTLAVKTLDLGAHCPTAEMSKNLPPDFDLPSNLDFSAPGQGAAIMKETPLGNGKSEYESIYQDNNKLSQVELKGRKYLEKVVRQVAIRTHGMLLSERQIKDQVQQATESLANTRRRRHCGVYDGSSLFMVQFRANLPGFSFIPGRKLARDLSSGVKFPWLVLKSKDRYRAELCREAAEASYAKDSSIIDATIILALNIDRQHRMIAAGLSPRPQDTLSPEQKACTYIPCGRCCKSTLWADSKPGPTGFPFCWPCYSRLKQGAVGSTQNWLTECARTIINHTFEDKERRQREMDDVKKLMASKFSDRRLLDENGIATDRWFDDYQSAVCTTEDGARHTASSIDAAMPYGMSDRGEISIHAASNLAVCRQYINTLKNIQLPIFLAYLAQHKRRVDEIQGRPKDPDRGWDLLLNEERILKRCHRLAIVRRKFGYTKAARNNARVTAQQHQYDLQQMKTGLLRPSDVAKFGSRAVAPFRSDWRFSGQLRERMLAVSADLERVFGVKFPRAKDGFPFFSHKKALPKWFDAESAYRLCAERRDRIDELCNWDEVTEDEPDGIWAEIFFQQCVRFSTLKDDPELSYAKRRAMKKRYKELFGLPIAVEGLNACMIAVAHSEHGTKQISGWRLAPKSFADRDDDLNNMLIETQTSNFAKMDYPKKHYKSIRDGAKSFKCSSKWIAFQKGKLRDDPALAADISGIDEEEAMNMAEYAEVGVEHDDEAISDGEEQVEDDVENDEEEYKEGEEGEGYVDSD